jgi:GT2 family glycosyltransferase
VTSHPEPASGSGQLDVCIVSWESRELLRTCLRSVQGRTEVASIVVVDNASGDGTTDMVREQFPSVRLIANDENRGFAAGSNQAIRATQAPFVLLLNPDTEVLPGALAALLSVFEEDPRAGAAAAQLILPDGSVQPSCRSFPEPAALLYDALGLARLFPSSEILGRYRMTYWDHRTRREVEQPMASALALRRAALDEIGLFDEDFPLYFNDVDLCYRLREARWRIIFDPAAKVRHYYGESSTWRVRPAAIEQSHRSWIRFYRKHYRGRLCWCSYATTIAAAWLTMWPRVGLAWLAQRLRGG